MDVKTMCLGILSLGEASGYEIKKMLEGPLGSFFDASFGSIYPALSQLTESGQLVMSEKAQDKRPDKKIYRITQKGRLTLTEALLAKPTRDRVRSDFLASILFADLLAPRELAERLDDRLAYHRAMLDRLANYRAKTEEWGTDELTAGMRFFTDYGLAIHKAALDFIEQNRHVVEAASMLRRGQAAD